MEQPLVSIITPCLNLGVYLEETLQSVLKQSYPSIEHVFVDGGSTDGTLEALAAYSAKHPNRITLISAPGTAAGDAWNIGLKAAKGDIFGCLGDDICEPGAVEAVVDFFRSNPEAHFVHGHHDEINERGELVGKHIAKEFNFKDFVNTARHISTPSSYYKREVMEKIGWLDSSGDDFDVMIRIAQQFQMHRMDRVLSKLRLRANSAFVPTNPRKINEAYRDTYRVSRRYGGSAFSRLALRYYRIQILCWLHLESQYPALMKGWIRMRRMVGV